MTPRFTPRQLDAFVAVAELTNFSLAARRLNLTPSAVSNLISVLELTLGFVLFERTTRRVEPDTFDVDVNADRVKDADGNRVDNIEVDFLLRFPEGEDGDRARKLIDRAIASAHDKLCTVSRTVELGTPVAMRSVD